MIKLGKLNAFLFFIILSLIATATSMQHYVSVVVREGKDVSAWKIIWFNFSYWWFWLAFLPLIIRIINRFPVRRGKLILAIVVNIIFSLLFSFVHEFVTAWWCNTIFGSMYYMPVIEKTFYRLFKLSMIIVDLSFYWAALTGLVAYDYFRKYQERELRCSQLENLLVTSQLQALKMQLHPHFFYNTLNSICTLVRTCRNEDAVKTINRFCEFLRMTLEQNNTDKVPLQKELAFIQCYLDVEKIRFQDKLQFQFNIQKETLAAQVPNLILQPIVENAVRHGIRQIETTGRLLIYSERTNGMLRLQVEDNGPGMSTGETKGLIKQGIGLKNTTQRLTNLYGMHHRFLLENQPGGGMLVTIEIPYEEGDGKEDAAVLKTAQLI